MRSEHRRGFGDRIAHRSFGKGGVNNNNGKISPPTTQVGRPVRPYCFGAQKDPRGRGAAGLWPCRPALAVLAMARKPRPALACAPPRRSRRLPTLRGLPKAEPNLISSQPSQMTGL